MMEGLFDVLLYCCIFFSGAGIGIALFELALKLPPCKKWLDKICDNCRIVTIEEECKNEKA